MITAVTGIALLLAALSTGIHFFWGGGTYSLLTLIPALQILSGLAAAIACFAARGAAARPAAGVAAGLLLTTNLSSLLLYLEHSRYYALGAHGNWLTIPAALGAIIAIITVLIPTPDNNRPTPPHQSPTYPNPVPGQPYSAPAAPAPTPAATMAPTWQQPAAVPADPGYHGTPGNPSYPGAPGHPSYGAHPGGDYAGGTGHAANHFNPGHP
ncbi:hypothetical protein GCM10027167_49160 [Nocardia heshunensis]